MPMNPVNKAQLTEFSQANAFSQLSESDQFELYVIYSILNGGSGEAVDPFGAHLKGTEFGLDGVAIIVQGNLVCDRDEAAAAIESVNNPQVDFYFFQSKTGTSFDYGEMAKFFDAINAFFEGTLVGESNQLDDLINAKDFLYENAVTKNNPGIYCYFATTGNYERQNSTDRLIENTKNGFIEKSIFDVERIQIAILGASDLQRLYRAASISTEVKLQFENLVSLPDHESVDEGYIGHLPAKELIKIISQYDEDGEIVGIKKSIFFDNVRDYNPSSPINKEIIEDLKSGRSANFVYRNNGITAVCKSISRTKNNFTINDYQIVNGCQTSNIIFHNRDYVDNLSVPFRLIATKDEYFISLIISGTNKQNEVRSEQFWSLLPFMKNLEEFSRNESESRRIYFERRENQYKGEAIEKTRVVQMQPFFKSVTASLLGLPHRAARNYKSEIENKVDIIFSEDEDVRPAFAAGYMHYRLEFLWRNQKIESENKIYRYYIFHALVKAVLPNCDFLGLQKKGKEKFSSDLVELCESDEKIIEVIERVKTVLDEKLTEMGALEEREKLRDTIRSESFFLDVSAKY